jgi:Ca2+-binding RTX toxin-like protein
MRNQSASPLLLMVPLRLPPTASATINSAGDADWFAVTLATGQTYRLEALGSGTSNGTLSDPTLSLYSSTGTTLAYNDDGGVSGNSLLTFTATTGGTYYLGARGYGSATGSYQVRASIAGPVDDYAANTATTGALAVGGTSSGTVNTTGDADWFRITLNAGQTYRLEALGAGTGNGTLADPYLSLYSGSGSLVTSNDDGGTNGNSLITYTAATSGAYYLGTSGYSSTTGSYQVRATSVVVDDYAASTATTGALAVGGSRSGTINSSGDADWFRITLNAGQTYRLEALGAGTGNGTLSDPYLTLYTSAGSALASNDDGGSNRDSLLTYTASASGTYYVGARGFGSSVGTYLVRASSDDYAASTATTGNVTLNTARSGAIESASDQDWFAAALTAGTTYTLQLRGSPSGSGPLADPYFRGIYTSTGSLIAGTSNDDYGTGRESRVVFTPTSSGTYYLAAGAYGSGTGTYQLLVSGAAPTDLSANINTTGSVEVGGSLRSLITPAGDVDWVRATLTQGQTYVIELNADTTASNPLADPYLRGIYNAAGTLLAGTSNDDYGIGTNSRVTFTATSTGTYYLAAGGFGTQIGAYELRLSTGTAPVTDAQANSTATTAALTVGTATTASIDFARDEDWFRVSLTAGQTYRISARGADSGAGTLADPRLVGLFDAGGHIVVGTGVDNGDGTPDAQTLYTATAGGTYYVAVAAANDGTGSYAVQVQTVTSSADLPANVGTTATLGVGGTQSSVIDTAGDADWFGVSLTAGTTYQIDMLGSATSSGSLTDPFILGLYDASGTYVNNTRDDDSGTGNNARVTFTATDSGTYYLAAGAYGSTSGSYQVTLTAMGSDSTAPTLLGTAPSDNATSVAPTSNLSLQFSEAVRAGTGNIVITGGGTTRTIAVTDTSQVSFSGSTLTINPSEDLAANTDYSVTLGAGVVRDIAGNAFAGIASNTQFNFHTTAAGQQDTWTVLVYMAADNNLESFGIDDLNEMESVTLPSNANVTVLVDRAGGYDSSNGNWTDTRWGAITHDSNTSTLGSSLTSLGERNTGDAATLTQFINNAVAANPASHYALIVWDHGGGLSGTSWDDASGGDNLSLAEYRAALQASSVSHFDIVGFDACLQGMIEQAWDVAGLSDVLVASQELEPGDGWEYQNVLGTLANNPSATAFDLAAGMVSSYGDRYAGQSDITMAATRTASLTALKTALDNFANTAINAGGGITSQLLSAASRATAIDGGSQNYRDLGDFMQEVASSMSGTAVGTAAQQVYAALDSAVLSQSGSVAGANGLSIYLPLSFIASTYNTDRYTFLQDSGWGNFLRFMLGDQGNDTLTGNANANTFMGFGGNDVLRGAGGNDTLTGGAGSDQFVFDAALSGAGVDTLTDFTRGADKIVLDDDVFTALGTTGTVAGVALSAAAFNAGSSAVDAADRIVYNSSSGALYYDSDGSGSAAARQIALLGTTTHPTGLSASDFLVIA